MSDTFALRCKPVVFATVTCSPKKALGPEFSIPAFQDTKSRASSMNWVPVFPCGEKGQRVGVGWHGGQDGTCLSCRRGDFRNCRNLKIPGISYDGGYQQYMVAPVEALAAIPESLSDVEAAPLLCAGITTFNALRHSGA